MKKYFAFQWHITDSCDQRCQHCYIYSSSKPFQFTETSQESLDQILSNCLDMCKQMDRIPYFYITGGDPILHSRFWNLLDVLKKNNINFTILGNPFHLNDEVCKKLFERGCERYQLSLDGLRETHDLIRMPGSFDITLKKIDTLKNAGIRTAIMTTVSKKNITEIPSLIDVVVESKANVFAFGRYCPTSSDVSDHVTPLEYRTLLESCWSKFESYKDSEIVFNLKDHLWTLFLYEKGLFKIPENIDKSTIYEGCNCGNSHMTILPSGQVYACRRFESYVGNALSEKLYDVFTGQKMNQFRDYNKFEKCSRCELLQFCRGCPAVAYGYTKNMYAPDPQCWKEVV